MERRKQPRFEADQPVRVTILGGSGRPLAGRILNFSGTGMRLEVPEAILPGTALEIDWDQTLVLAEVCYCLPAPAGFVAGVVLEHCLFDTGELARLARTLVGETEILTPHS